jgi:plastocyanin
MVMTREQIPATNEREASTIDRRHLLHRGAAFGLIVPAFGLLDSSAAAQEAGTAMPASSPAAAVTVKMTSRLRFEPPDVTIKRGETIIWVNTSPIPHTTTGDPAKNPVKETRPQFAQLPPGAEPWDSGLIDEGESFSYTFAVSGEYTYFCIPHLLSGMLGMVTVTE